MVCSKQHIAVLLTTSATGIQWKGRIISPSHQKQVPDTSPNIRCWSLSAFPRHAVGSHGTKLCRVRSRSGAPTPIPSRSLARFSVQTSSAPTRPSLRLSCMAPRGTCQTPPIVAPHSAPMHICRLVAHVRILSALRRRHETTSRWRHGHHIRHQQFSPQGHAAGWGNTLGRSQHRHRRLESTRHN